MKRYRTDLEAELGPSFRLVALGIFLALCGVGSQPLGAQSPTQYVCQCQGFWCVYTWTPGIPDGWGCYCNTAWGPAVGYTIGLAQYPQLPTGMPEPQEVDPTRPPERTTGQDVEVSSDECYNGLGNCPGSFRAAAERGSVDEDAAVPNAGAERPRLSRDGETLLAVIDGARQEFRRFIDRPIGTGRYPMYHATVRSLFGLGDCEVVHLESGDSVFECTGRRSAYRGVVEAVSNALGPPDREYDARVKWEFPGDVTVNIRQRSRETELEVQLNR